MSTSNTMFINPYFMNCRKNNTINMKDRDRSSM